MGTKIMPISDLRRRPGQVIKVLREGGEPIYITQHGRPAAVLIDFAAFEEMQARLALQETAGSATAGQSSLATLTNLAEDLGVDDLAEQHDHYLYGTPKG